MDIEKDPVSSCPIWECLVKTKAHRISEAISEARVEGAKDASDLQHRSRGAGGLKHLDLHELCRHADCVKATQTCKHIPHMLPTKTHMHAHTHAPAE